MFAAGALPTHPPDLSSEYTTASYIRVELKFFYIPIKLWDKCGQKIFQVPLFCRFRKQPRWNERRGGKCCTRSKKVSPIHNVSILLALRGISVYRNSIADPISLRPADVMETDCAATTTPLVHNRQAGCALFMEFPLRFLERVIRTAAGGGRTHNFLDTDF